MCEESMTLSLTPCWDVSGGCATPFALVPCLHCQKSIFPLYRTTFHFVALITRILSHSIQSSVRSDHELHLWVKRWSGLKYAGNQVLFTRVHVCVMAINNPPVSSVLCQVRLHIITSYCCICTLRTLTLNEKHRFLYHEKVNYCPGPEHCCSAHALFLRIHYSSLGFTTGLQTHKPQTRTVSKANGDNISIQLHTK